MSWKGTAVPNSGTVDKLYLNDKVSFQEIYNLLSSIEYAPYDDNGFFEIYIALNCDGGSMFGILKKNNTDTPRGIEYDINVDGNTVWTSVNDEGFTSYGLNVLATQQNYGYIPNTGEALDKGSIGTKEYEVGLQNDKISSIFSITPFEEVQEEVTLEGLFTDIADAIREKKGIEKEEKWVGTAVPNTGHIEKLYFNTELSNEEVEKLVRNLQPTIILPGVSAYLLLNSAEYSAGQFDTCMIMWKDDGIGISWESSTNKIPIFFTSPTLASENKVDPTGWQTFDNPIEINVDVVNESPNGFPSGSQNNKLTSLVSITPFEKKTTGLIPALDFPSEIRSIETGGELLEPTAVPISGMVEKVYFNFNVDVSKMVEVIKNLSFIDAGLGVPVYPIISNIAGTDGLLFVKINDNFYYLQRGETHLIASISKADTEPEYEIKIIDNRDDSNFYKNDFTQPMEFGFENAVELATSSIPDYVNSNELLKEMISITPIQKIGGEGIEGIIEVEQLPVVEYSGTVVPNSGMVETIHFNTNLSTNEVVKELEKLTYVETPLAPFPVSVLFATEDFSKVIIATKYTYTSGDLSGQVDYDIYEFTNFGQDSETTTTLFSTMLTQPEDAGWKVENGYYIEANKNVINDYSGLPIGTENDKISSLFSLTPIELNIDTSKIYFVNAIFGNILLYEEGTLSSFEDLTGGNGTLEYYYAKTKPTTDIKEVDMQNMIFRVYYIEDENDIFVYGDLAGDGSKIWMTLGTLVFEGRASFGGYINDISQANESGYYAMPKESFYKFSNGWVEYKYGGIVPSGTWYVSGKAPYRGTIDVSKYQYVDIIISSGGSGQYTITSNGTYNVENYASVYVNVVPSGGTKSITSNGFYNVSNYASANVNVPTANVKYNTHLSKTIYISNKTNQAYNGVYFNISLTKEEVLEYFKLLTYDSNNQYAVYLGATKDYTTIKSIVFNYKIDSSSNVEIAKITIYDGLDTTTGTDVFDYNNGGWLITTSYYSFEAHLYGVQPTLGSQNLLISNVINSNNTNLMQGNIVGTYKTVEKIITPSDKDTVYVYWNNDFSSPVMDKEFVARVIVRGVKDNLLSRTDGTLTGEYSDNRAIEVKGYSLAYTNINKASLINATNYGEGVFYECSNLREVELNQTIDGVAKKMFYNTSITTINLPNCSYVGDYSFYSCSSLTSVTFSENFTTVGENAFENCDNLNSFPYKLKVIKKSAFSGCRSISDFDLSSALYIYESAFKNCLGLTSINIVSNLEILGEYAFQGCSGLTNIYIENSVSFDMYIGDMAFNGCTNVVKCILKGEHMNLSGVAFGSTRNYDTYALKVFQYEGSGIPNYTFQYCSNLEVIILSRTTDITTISRTYSLEGATKFTEDGTGIVYVTDELVETYKTDTYWKSALVDVNTQIRPVSEYVEE